MAYKLMQGTSSHSFFSPLHGGFGEPHPSQTDALQDAQEQMPKGCSSSVSGSPPFLHCHFFFFPVSLVSLLPRAGNRDGSESVGVGGSWAETRLVGSSSSYESAGRL